MEKPQAINEYRAGLRVLFLIRRSKEGGGTNNDKIKKYVVNGEDEYNERLETLERERKDLLEKGIVTRIYASLNRRDINKAIREFKRQQLEADYYDEENKNRFYLDVKNKWISALMKPSSRADNLFLIDIDIEKVSTKVIETLEAINAETKLTYKTKNGWHIITTPFNPAELNGIDGVEVKKDALMLVSY